MSDQKSIMPPSGAPVRTPLLCKPRHSVVGHSITFSHTNKHTQWDHPRCCVLCPGRCRQVLTLNVRACAPKRPADAEASHSVTFRIARPVRARRARAPERIMLVALMPLSIQQRMPYRRMAEYRVPGTCARALLWQNYCTLMRCTPSAAAALPLPLALTWWGSICVCVHYYAQWREGFAAIAAIATIVIAPS